VLRDASRFHYFLHPCPVVAPFGHTRQSLLTSCWQQAFDRKGAGKLTGLRLLFERK